MAEVVLGATLEFPNWCPVRENMLSEVRFKNPAIESIKKYSKNPSWALSKTPPYVCYYEEDQVAQVLRVPIGLKGRLLTACSTCQFGCSVMDKRSLGVRYPEEMVPKKPLVLRTSQERALRKIESIIGFYGVGLVQMPTGTGKTILGMVAANRSKLKTLFITHTKDLAQQTIDAYEELFGEKAGLIGDGEKDLSNRFTVAIIDSIYVKKMYDELNDHFGFIIFDEVHRIVSNKSFKPMMKLSAKYRLGLTATPDTGSELSKVLISYFGGVVEKITIPEALAEKSLVPLRVKVLNTEFVPSMDAQVSFKAIEQEASTDLHRNQIISRYVEECAGNGDSCILVLNSLKQCHFLQSMFQGSEFVRSAVFTGDESREDRRTILTDAKSGKVNVLLTVVLAGMGLDIPRANHLIFDRFIQAPLSVEQIVGRVVRSCPSVGKQFATVTDVCNPYYRPIAGMSYKRFRIYKKFEELVSSGQMKLML